MIQLAIAPVFVLVAIGNIMNLLTNRLGRVVDRSRDLQRSHAETEGSEHDAIVREFRIIDRRIELISQSMLALVLTALSIGGTIVVLFLQEFVGLNLQGLAAGSFILAIALLMWALVLFLRETRLATATLRVSEKYLENDRRL